MSHITTHVLDAALGRPAAGVAVTLLFNGSAVATGTTDVDGRVSSLGPDELTPGTYTLQFNTHVYFGETPSFYPQVTIDFAVTGPEHYHVPLLLSPFGYSTYRGS